MKPSSLLSVCRRHHELPLVLLSRRRRLLQRSSASPSSEPALGACNVSAGVDLPPYSDLGVRLALLLSESWPGRAARAMQLLLGTRCRSLLRWLLSSLKVRILGDSRTSPLVLVLVLILPRHRMVGSIVRCRSTQTLALLLLCFRLATRTARRWRPTLHGLMAELALMHVMCCSMC